MEWNHIMDSQPEHDSEIVQVHPPYEGHYTMGMRKYYQTVSFEELLKYYRDSDLPDPDFWWVYAEDFPFPRKTNE